jgi:putative nucleotidyltransferase with HDIG domain
MTRALADTVKRPNRRGIDVRQDAAADPRVWLFVFGVSVSGAMAIGQALRLLYTAPLSPWAAVLALLTVVSGRFAVKMPGRSATVSVSEVFVFTSLLLFGPPAATVTMALDGLCIATSQRRRRVDRALFNIAEPALSIWVAGFVFLWLGGRPSFGLAHVDSSELLLPAFGMTATYFVLNSTLQASVVAFESGAAIFEVWSQHALYLSLNYYAAASIATLAVHNAPGLNLEVVGLVAPLLVLSYVAYKTSASRMEDAQRHIGEVEHLYQATVETLAIAVDAKDQVTHGHIRRVQRHTLALARAVGITDEFELKAIEAASLLHDVGKLAVPDYVLNKPGALTPSEFDRIKLHAAKGAEILTTVEFPYPVVPIVRHHHEQWGGQGYPDGLSGEHIPLGARILTVVDCFDAVTSDRPYRRRMTDEEAIDILRGRSGNMYDPRVVEAFIALVPSLRQSDRLAEAERPEPPAQGEVAPTASLPRLGDSPAKPSEDLVRLRAIATHLAEKIQHIRPGAEVCLFSCATGAQVLVPAQATPRLCEVFSQLSLVVGEGLSGWVAANRHTIVNSDPGLDLGDAAARLGLRSCLSTPVFALGDLVGVLSVYLPEAGAFCDADVRVVGVLAQEVGLEVAYFGREYGAFVQRPAASARGERRIFQAS